MREGERVGSGGGEEEGVWRTKEGDERNGRLRGKGSSMWMKERVSLGTERK